MIDNIKFELPSCIGEEIKPGILFLSPIADLFLTEMYWVCAVEKSGYWH